MSNDHENDSATPRWAQSLLTWAAPSDRVDEVLGDLTETHRRRARQHKRLVASLLTAFEAIDVAVALLRERGDRHAIARHRDAEAVGHMSRTPMWLDSLALDLRYTMRGLRTHPGFTTAVVGTLALGIGVNAAIFPVVDRLLFRLPPGLAAPALTNRVYLALPTPDGAGQLFIDDISRSFYDTFVTATHSFDRLAQYEYATAVVGSGEGVRELPVGVVSSSFFDFFNSAPALGRYFVAAENALPAGGPVVVLSYDTWQTRYAGRANAIGSALRIGSSVYTVIGVAPRGFAGVWPEHPPVAFVPTAAYYAASAVASGRRGNWWTSSGGTFLVQRKPGVDLRTANADLTNALTQIWAVQMKGLQLPAAAPAKPHAIAASLLTERGPNQSSVAKVAALIGGMAIVVLLIAWANVANLLLARAMRRRRETAVRLALGISRQRLVSQLLTESVVLSILGGIAALVAGGIVGVLLNGLIVRDSAASILPDWRTLAFVASAVVATAILTGLGPALLVRRHELTRHLKIGASDNVQRSHLRLGLLVAQTAMSVLLLVGAGLFVRSLDNVRRQPLGYNPAPVLSVDIAMADVRLDKTQAIELRQRLLAAAQQIPSVEHAALEYGLPLAVNVENSLRVPGMDSAVRTHMPDFYYNSVSPDYFATMGTRILRGRAIGREDAAGAPGAIVVSATLATLLWPGQDPLGRCVYIQADTTCTNVVGVAEDIRATTLSDAPAPYYYLSAAQFRPERIRGLALRMRGNAADQAELVRSALQREMPGASYVTVKPFTDVVDEASRSWRLGATIFALFGMLALVLAAVGLYGVIAYNVTQRTHEIGVRMAVGARGVDVLWLIVRQGVALGAAGVVIGTAITLGAAGQIATLLFGVSARDPMIYMSVAAGMLAVAIAASFIPAYRAARVDPNIALRAE